MPEIRLNLNDSVRFKLTDVGRDIYYHRFDKLKVKYPYCRISPSYPKEDKNGYATMQLWDFIQLYGSHIGMGMPNVIEPLDLVFYANDNEQPRVLTLEEVTAKTNKVWRKDQGPLIWIEDRTDNSLEPAVYCDFDEINKEYNFWTIGIETECRFPIAPRNICHGTVYKYGHNFRCWSKQPSDEQRKAVKWDA